MPVMLVGMPCQPPIGSSGLLTSGSTFCTLTWIGLRPVCSAERDGEQYLKV